MAIKAIVCLGFGASLMGEEILHDLSNLWVCFFVSHV